MKALQLKIQLKGFKPSNYRTILIDEKQTFTELHQIIQELFWFFNYHLREFSKIENNRYVLWIWPEIEDEFEWLWFRDKETLSEKTKLKKIFKDRNIQKLLYCYDFGDNWYFDIMFEKEIEVEDKLPKVLRWKWWYLVEDCWWVWWLMDMIEIYKNQDKKEAENRWYDDWQEFKEMMQNVVKEVDWQSLNIDMVD